MDEDCRVFLIGDSLFTESLSHLLADEAGVQLVGTAVFATLDKTAVIEARPHVIVVAGIGQHTQDASSSLLAIFPDTPIINADLNQDFVQVITSRRVHARRPDLLAAIMELSKRIKD